MNRQMRENMVDLLLLNGNREELRRLEGQMELNFGFVMDNGKEISRKKNEGLGNFIERYTVSLMKNFSRKKYENLKAMCAEYNTFGDSRVVEENFDMENVIVEKRVSAFERFSESVEEFISGIFRKERRAI